MASVVRKLVTEWVYKVDASQLKAAETMVKKLGDQIQKQMIAADKLSVKQNNHFAQMSTNYNKLTASMNKFRKAQFRMMNQSGLSGGWGLGYFPGGKKVRGRKPKGGGGGGGGSAVDKAAQKAGRFSGIGKSLGFGKGQGQSVRFGSSGISTIGVGAGGALAAGIAYMGKGIIDLGMGFEAAQSNFGTLLGSQEKATKLLKELRDFAEKTPFELTKIRTNAQQILGAGFKQEEIIPTMKLLGDLAQGDDNNFRLLLNNFAQIKNDNVALLKDIRQFSTVGIDIRSALRKSEGITEEQLSAMISQGKISFDMIKRAMKTLNSPGGPFFKGMERANKTLVGKLSQLKDAMDAVGEDASKGSVLDLLKEATDNATAWITKNRKGIVSSIEGALEFPAEFARDLPKAMENLKKLSKDLTGNEDFLGQMISFGGMVALGVFSPAAAFLLILEDVVKTLADPNAKTGLNALRNFISTLYEGSDEMVRTLKEVLGLDAGERKGGTQDIAGLALSTPIDKLLSDTKMWRERKESYERIAKRNMEQYGKVLGVTKGNLEEFTDKYNVNAAALKMRTKMKSNARKGLQKMFPGDSPERIEQILNETFDPNLNSKEQKALFDKHGEAATMPGQINRNLGSITNTNNNSDVSIIIQGYNRDPEELAQAIRRETTYVT